MNLFALDSSSNSCFSVSFFSGNIELFKKKIEAKITTQLFCVLNEAKEYVKSCDCFAVNIGPGSYTSLRAGIAAIKGITAVNCKKIKVATNFQICAFKFFAKKSNKELKINYVDVLLKSYNPDFFYHQKINKDFSAASKPVQICNSELKKADCSRNAGNIEGFCQVFETSASDLAEFIINNSNDKEDSKDLANPLYIT